MLMLVVAEKLGKFVHEVEQELTWPELHEWYAYIKLKNDEQKKAADKAKQEVGRGSGRAGRKPRVRRGR